MAVIHFHPGTIASPFQRHDHHITRHLYPYLLSKVSTPFAYGENDCCMFACGAVLAMTGVDIAADFRGKYSDGPGAVRAIATVTGVDPEKATVEAAADWIAKKFGIAELPSPLYAQRGDLVLASAGDVDFLAVVALSGHEAAIPGARGIAHLPLMTAKKGWRI